MFALQCKSSKYKGPHDAFYRMGILNIIDRRIDNNKSAGIIWILGNVVQI